MDDGIGVGSLEERKEKIIKIIMVSSYIENMIEFVLDGRSIRYNKESFGDKIKEFKLYLDRRSLKTVNTNEKIFGDNKYSLEDILWEVQKIRNIIAHEAAFLLLDVVYELPIRMPGIRLKRRKHKGTLEELYDNFVRYTGMIPDLYEMVSDIGSNAFEVFDINGQQIGPVDN